MSAICAAVRGRSLPSESEQLKECLPRIIDWYAGSRRVLPWRQEPTPYHVWISEIMLQQTRIEAAIAYYERFLRELPTVEALAAVDEDRLMKLWEGLGYYSRARNLKKAAVLLTEQYGGQLPREAAVLKKLPGIGDYTAGAIASIAYGQPEPAVDGNVLRVLSRVLDSEEDVLSPQTRRRMAALLREQYPTGERAGLLTEGLMELGETLCIPNGEAHCELCPVRTHCLARARNRVAELPVKAAPKARRMEERTVLLLRCGDRWAIRRREAKGLLAGLWEYPNLLGHLTGQEAAAWAKAQGAEPLAWEDLGQAVHVFSHVEWHMRGYRVDCDREAEGFLWAESDAIAREYSIPTAFRFYHRQVLEA